MRKLLIVLLALGAIVGFSAGFARLFHYGPGPHGFHRREHFERRVADVCVEAAERRLREGAAPTPGPPR